MGRYRLRTLCSLVIAIIILTSCHINTHDDTLNKTGTIIEKDSKTITFKDALGKKQTIGKNPQRVVSLYSSYTKLWALAGGQLVGRVESANPVPESVKDVEIVGGTGSPNIEKIISLEPDLVMLSPTMNDQNNIIDILKQNDIDYMALRYDNFTEYLNVLKLFTSITDRDDLYKTYGEQIEEDIRSLIKKVSDQEEPDVLLLFTTARGVSARLPNSTVGSMLEDLGAKNIAYDAQLSNEQMQTFSMERILERDPDFIFVQTMGSDISKIEDRIKKDVESNPAWGSLKAVKSGRYIFLDKELYLYKPNDRYYEAYEGLAKILYPDIFR